jgi:hypothetical protein
MMALAELSDSETGVSDMVKAAVLLAPIAYMQHMKSQLLSVSVDLMLDKVINDPWLLGDHVLLIDILGSASMDEYWHVLNVAIQIIGIFGTREFNLNKCVMINLHPPWFLFDGIYSSCICFHGQEKLIPRLEFVMWKGKYVSFQWHDYLEAIFN